MDYHFISIAAIVSISGFYFHWWLYVRIKRWVNRDLALSMAGQDKAKKEYMLKQLELAQQQKIPKAKLAEWLQDAADRYPSKGGESSAA